MLQTKEIFRIPSVRKAMSFHAYFRDTFTLLKRRIPSSSFLSILSSMGIKSRVSYRSLVAGKRSFDSKRLNKLSNVLDHSHSERRAISALHAGFASEIDSDEMDYYTCSPHVLSHPINTIVLNLCGLPHRMDEKILCDLLKKLFSAEEVGHAIALLEEADLIFRDETGGLKRNKELTLSTLPGVKAEHSRNYYRQTFALAEAQLDLDLAEREYIAFSTHIRRADLPKLKDLARQFRRSVYELSKGQSDAVIHVNLNAFLMASISTDSEESGP